MYIIILQVLFVVAVIGLIVVNHIRINNLSFENEQAIQDTKKKINAINTILLQKYDKKQNLDSKIMKLVVDKVDILEKKIQQRKINVDIELESLKKTLTYLRDQQKVFYDFRVDQEDN
jgi:hypothetical protein